MTAGARMILMKKSGSDQDERKRDLLWEKNALPAPCSRIFTPEAAGSPLREIDALYGRRSPQRPQRGKSPQGAFGAVRSRVRCSH
jgi:hypothetical protein